MKLTFHWEFSSSLNGLVAGYPSVEPPMNLKIFFSYFLPVRILCPPPQIVWVQSYPWNPIISSFFFLFRKLKLVVSCRRNRKGDFLRSIRKKKKKKNENYYKWLFVFEFIAEINFIDVISNLRLWNRWRYDYERLLIKL